MIYSARHLGKALAQGRLVGGEVSLDPPRLDAGQKLANARARRDPEGQRVSPPQRESRHLPRLRERMERAPSRVRTGGGGRQRAPLPLPCAILVERTARRDIG